MQVIGIIAEYNPFHSGHRYHIQKARAQIGADSAVLCVMSGNWVQRGDAAIIDKWSRSAMALRGGCDLVIELPTPWAISSAEQFAWGAVSLLNATGVVDALSFGSENGDLSDLRATAACLDTEAYRIKLQDYLFLGLSFPAARHGAARELLGDAADCLRHPNNNLGTEYLRALCRSKSAIAATTVSRQGAAHDSGSATSEYASASYLREALLCGSAPQALLPYLSEADADDLPGDRIASLQYGSRAVFSRLRTMEPEEFLLLPDSGEGLHHLLHKAARQTDSLKSLYEAVKSKRYTHARIRRLVLWAFLGLTAGDRTQAPPYIRVLGMNKRGKELLRIMKTTATLPVITKPSHARRLQGDGQRLFELEARCTGLYDLCRAGFGDGDTLSEFQTNPVII